MNIANKIVGNIIGTKKIKTDYKSKNNNSLKYRRVIEDGMIGNCEMCGEKTKLIDDLCYKCRNNK